MADGHVILCLQGGGALAAYQVGVIRALHEAGVVPTIVAATSTGALNAAVLVAHRRNDPDGALAAFWGDLASPSIPFMPDLGAALGAYGNPAMYRPRGDLMGLGRWSSLYDTSPLARTLDRHVDPERLHAPNLRLLLTATDLETGAGEVFDSDAQPLGASHVLAASALPPTFPPVSAVNAEGQRRSYWDGSIAGPTLLAAALERVDPTTVARAVVIDLFPRRGGVPSTMAEVGARMLELISADRNAAVAADAGLEDRLLVVAPSRPESAVNAADFGARSLRGRIEAGYRDARRRLATSDEPA